MAGAGVAKVGVLGAGAFGTALANVAARAGAAVTLWARDAALVAEVNERRSNAKRLPGASCMSGWRRRPTSPRRSPPISSSSWSRRRRCGRSRRLPRRC